MFKDEASENTLKKRREYYLKHGVKNVFPSGLLESSSLDITTPYMLRNDGELLKCGDYHPYIKSSYKEDTQQSLYYLFYLHLNFIEWFYNNSLNEETKSNIKKLIYLVDDRYDLGPVIKDITREEENEILENIRYLKNHIGIEEETCSIKDIVDILWDLTNQEFCRVRTSNYRYKTGGDNGEIYFRISSENFNWFDLIWNVCVKFIHSIDYITIMKDPQTFGKQFNYIKIKDTKINKLPIKDFIELEDEPLVESQYNKKIKLELNNYNNDELLKKIKRFYVSGILTEDKNKSLTLQDIFSYISATENENQQDKKFYSLKDSNDSWEIIKEFEESLVLIVSTAGKKDIVDKKELTPVSNSLLNNREIIIKDELFDFIDNCLGELYDIKQSNPEEVSFLKLAFSELKEAKIPVGYRYAKVEKNKIYCFRKSKGSGGTLRVFFFIKNDKIVCFKAWLKGSKTEENKIINQGVKKYLNYNK